MNFLLEQIHSLANVLALQINSPRSSGLIFYGILFILLIFLISVILKVLQSFFSTSRRQFNSLMASINERSRSRAQTKAVMKNIKKALSRNDYKTAAGLFVSIDELSQAAELFVMANDFSSAAALYEQIKNIEKAASLYKQAGNRTKSAELFVQLGSYKDAAAMYETAGMLKNAAELYEKSKDYFKAAEVYERCFIEEGHRQRDAGFGMSSANASGKLYEKAGRYDKAIAVYLKDNLFLQAALVYAHRGDFINAGECYLKAGELNKAADAFKLAGDLKKSNEVFSQIHYGEGRIKEAAELAEKADNFIEAAEKYLEAGDFLKAGELFFKAGHFNDAGEMFFKIGDFAKAGNSFEKSGNLLWAANAYEKAGSKTGNVPDLYEKAGEYFEAGRRYHELGLTDKALNSLQKIEPDSEGYGEASTLIGKIFLDKGMIQPAMERFQKTISNKPLNKLNIEPYYFLALSLEKSGEMEKAKALYEKILAEDFHFRDTAKRLKEIALTPNTKTIPIRNESPMEQRYKLLEEVGRGGMGVVYKAKDTVLNRIVAYKLLPPVLTANSIYLERFMKEARLSANLNHSNIVMIFDTGNENGNYYITMEFIDGKTLKDYLLAMQKFRVSDAVKISKQICRALAYAHNNRVVHRDIKPSNIMLSRERIIKIMDFGVAKVIEDASKELTSVSGTPLYMAPEQIIGMSVDYQSDLYSFGATLFELLTGRPPFTEGDLAYHHLHSKPPSPSEIDHAIPEALSRIILKCLEKDKTLRYKKAEDILADMDTITA